MNVQFSTTINTIFSLAALLSFIFVIIIMILQSKKLCFSFILLTVVCQYTVLAQASFSAKISPGSIGKNETAELRLIIDNARQVDQIIPPSLNNFIILSGPNQESGMESYNGATRQYIGITYQLKPKSTGKFTIAGALAKADGKTLKSNPVTLVVTNQSQGTNPNNTSRALGHLSPFSEPAVQSSFNDFIIKKGENLAEKINKNIFIKVDVSKYSCYVGEPVVVTYKLYTRLKSESSITKNPSFNGFSVIDLLPPGNTYYSVEKLNGREYNVYTLRKSQLYPLQEGMVELESTEVENNIHFIKEEYFNRQRNGIADLFREFTQTTIPAEGMHDEKVTLQSKPVLIAVKPLPVKDKSPLFKGAVGNFTIEAALEKNNFTTDDAGKLHIAISGEGNMTMVIAPDIPWPNGIEPYEPGEKEQLDKLTVPVSGVKVFEYPFTATKPGNYNIPAVVFNFFDAREGRYKTVSTKPLSVVVTKGIGSKPVKVNENNIKTGKEPFFDLLLSNGWLIVISLAILALTGLFIRMRKEKKKYIPALQPTENSGMHEDQKTIMHLRLNPLSLSEEKMISQDTRGFYQALNNELRKFLADKLQIPLATINKKRIAEEADKKGVAVATSLQIQQLLDDIEWQLYTPFAAEDKMQDMYNHADFIVHALNATTP
ncbi:MAG: protein BatD [Ferruginibacter sp.]|nr:protein BatD [Ferruginibacter sp.]